MFTLTLSIEQINVILRSLDQGPHAQVRQLIDAIIAEVNAQQAKQATVPEPEAQQ